MSASARPQAPQLPVVRCPSCGAPMVERLNRHTGGAFLGCSRYPDCNETREVPLYVKLRRAGHAPLPGFEDA